MIVRPEIEEYAEAHTSPDDALLAELAEETRATLPIPEMLTGPETRYYTFWLTADGRVAEITPLDHDDFVGGPAVRVLPGVPEPEHQRAQVVGLELPEDVAGPEPAAGAQDHRLGNGLAGVGGDQPPVGQHPGDRVGVGVDAAQQPVGVRREGVEDVAAGGGVALPRPGHAGADALLEVLVRGHRCRSIAAEQAAGPHAPGTTPAGGRARPAPGDPEDSHPLRPRKPGRVGARSGGRA